MLWWTGHIVDMERWNIVDWNKGWDVNSKGWDGVWVEMCALF